MEDTIIIILLVVIMAAAVYGIVKRIRFGSSCCGSKTPADKKVRVRDRNKAHYPYHYLLKVDGMHCANCARRVENAFNRTEGRWARVDLATRSVSLLSKQEETESELAGITAAAGYTMLSSKKQ